MIREINENYVPQNLRVIRMHEFMYDSRVIEWCTTIQHVCTPWSCLIERNFEKNIVQVYRHVYVVVTVGIYMYKQL